MSVLADELFPADPGAAVSVYQFPEIAGELVGGGGPGAMPTARELEELHRAAHAEGYAAGEAEGYAAGERRASALMQDRITRLDGILRDLAEPLAALDEAMVEQVAELAMLVARHLVRRELRTEPGEVVAVVRATMRHMPIASRGTTLRLNPDDVDLVRNALGLDDEQRSWRTEADPLVSRGGCIIESASSRIDATVESRLAAIASKMFGGERESDRA